MQNISQQLHKLHLSLFHWVLFQVLVLLQYCTIFSSSSNALIYKKLSYRRGTARCVVSVEILPIAMQQCSTASPEQIEVMKLEGSGGPMCSKHVHSTVTRSSHFHCSIGVKNKPTTDEFITCIPMTCRCEIF